MRKYIYLLLIVLMGNVGFAQHDPHFSQFMNAPLTINPAMAGVFYGGFRFSNTYRQQWATATDPFTTISSSADFPLLLDLYFDDMLAIGVNVLYDQAGASNLTNTEGNLTINYGKGLDPGTENHFLSMAIQGGIGQKSVSVANLTWDDQFNGKEFDPSRGSNETFTDESFMSFDVSGGIHYFGSFSDEFTIHTGAALFNINTPKISFMGQDQIEKRRLVVHSGLHLGFANNHRIQLLPNIMYLRQGQNHEIIGGSDVRFLLKEATQHTGLISEVSWSIGAFYRHADAIITKTQLNWAGFSVGVSYDLNISYFSNASRSLGGPEITLMYRTGYKAGRGKQDFGERFFFL